MNFLVNKILDDGSVSYGLTGSGYVVLIIVCVLLMTIGCFARDNNSKLNVKHIAFARSEKDRRVVLISLTEKGRRAYEHHRLFHDKMIKATIANMSEQEEEVLAQALTNLIGFFEQYQQ